jgi:cytochrome c oxidase subunit 1
MDAPPNPWRSLGMEWKTSSPPITHNFEETPVAAHGPYDYSLVEVER